MFINHSLLFKYLLIEYLEFIFVHSQRFLILLVHLDFSPSLFKK